MKFVVRCSKAGVVGVFWITEGGVNADETQAHQFVRRNDANLVALTNTRWERKYVGAIWNYEVVEVDDAPLPLPG
jgi:hypothetical protein